MNSCTRAGLVHKGEGNHPGRLHQVPWGGNEKQPLRPLSDSRHLGPGLLPWGS